MPIKPPPSNYPDWTDPSLPNELRWASRLAFWLDDGFRMPIIGRRFGLDAVTGLWPVVGDALSMIIALVPVAIALYWQLPARLIAPMLGVIVLDFFAGSIPIIGDLVDAGFKANRKNVQLLHKAWHSHRKHHHSVNTIIDTDAHEI